VCNFSWRGLLKIEGEIFFPWLSGILPTDMATTLINVLYKKHADIRTLSGKLASLCSSYSDESELEHISACLSEMLRCAASIERIQEDVFVPFVSAYVYKGEQERFNKRVIAKLGLIESQIHLVSMFDAIEALPTERRMFERQIPRIAQSLIPMWRKRLHNPRSRCLEQLSSQTATRK
jgi:hypothetical protein